MASSCLLWGNSAWRSLSVRPFSNAVHMFQKSHGFLALFLFPDSAWIIFFLFICSSKCVPVASAVSSDGIQGGCAHVPSSLDLITKFPDALSGTSWHSLVPVRSYLLHMRTMRALVDNGALLLYQNIPSLEIPVPEHDVELCRLNGGATLFFTTFTRVWVTNHLAALLQCLNTEYIRYG